MNNELVYGLHSVAALLKRLPERVLELWFLSSREDERLGAILEMAKDKCIEVKSVPKKTLDEMAKGGAHQGVIANVKPSKPTSEAELFAYLESTDEVPFLLILDGVQDPHNLGACFRTADAAGVQAIIVPQDRACSLTPVVRKVASGACETVMFVQVPNLVRTMKKLQEQKLWIIGTADQADEVSLFNVDLSGPIAFVMGAESQGLRRLTKQHCDYLVSIPMQGFVSSLNVSVATGVCLFEAVRQRSLGVS